MIHRYLSIILFFLLTLLSTEAIGTDADFVEFFGGSVFTIDYNVDHPNDEYCSARVDYEDEHKTDCTKINLIENGYIDYDMELYGYSELTINNGTVGDGLKARERSLVNFTSGTVHKLDSYDRSIIVMTNGIVETDFWSHHYSSVNIYGGQITNDLKCSGYSEMTVSGGIISGNIIVDAENPMIIEGRNFVINGQQVAYGDMASMYATSGTITGILANGDILDTSYNIYASGDITFEIPEPCTLGLLALGGVMLARRRKG